MKALSVLSLLCLLFSSASYAESNYLSQIKLKTFELEDQKLEQESKKLSRSWIKPIVLRYNLNYQNPYNENGAPQTKQQSASISLDQPIFQSGGIYYAINYADAARVAGELSLKQQQRSLEKSAIELLIKIRQADISIATQNLRIKNAKINLEQKRELYLSGQLDSGFLNSAALELNSLKSALLDIENSKELLLSSFTKISDADYKNIEPPKLQMIELDHLTSDSIDIKLARQINEQDRYFTDMTMAKYLPSFNIRASYHWQSQESFFFTGSNAIKSSPPDTTYYKYGLNISMPLDFNSYADYEATELAYLKSKLQIEDTERTLKALHESVALSLKHVDAKLELSKETQGLYASLLKDTKELYEAGEKTVHDLHTMQNSRDIELLNQQSLELDRELELLRLYEKFDEI